jgi:hypothetical protein
VRGGRACDVCAMARSSQQLQGRDFHGTGPRSGSAVLCGPIRLSGLCVLSVRKSRLTRLFLFGYASFFLFSIFVNSAQPGGEEAVRTKVCHPLCALNKTHLGSTKITFLFVFDLSGLCLIMSNSRSEP